MLTTQDWADFHKAIEEDAKKSFYNKEIIWLRNTERVDRWGEDNSDAPKESITLKCLINHNYMRSWPVTVTTESGELDKQSMQVLFIKKDLADLGYLTPEGYFNYDPSQDRFVVDGLIHKPVGDTPVSQGNGDDLIFSMILKREEPNTPNIR